MNNLNEYLRTKKETMERSSDKEYLRRRVLFDSYRNL